MGWKPNSAGDQENRVIANVSSLAIRNLRDAGFFLGRLFRQLTFWFLCFVVESRRYNCGVPTNKQTIGVFGTNISRRQGRCLKSFYHKAGKFPWLSVWWLRKYDVAKWFLRHSRSQVSFFYEEVTMLLKQYASCKYFELRHNMLRSVSCV